MKNSHPIITAETTNLQEPEPPLLSLAALLSGPSEVRVSFPNPDIRSTLGTRIPLTHQEWGGRVGDRQRSD